MKKIYRQGTKYPVLKLSVLAISLFAITYTYSQDKSAMLEKAYEEKSVKKLNDFFYAWNQDVPPITDVELATYNDTIRQAYKVFTTFYKPHRLDSIGDSEWGNDIYKNVDFLIVQNKLKIYFQATIEEYIINQINLSSLSDSKKIKLLKRINDGKLSRRTIRTFDPWNDFESGILTDSITNFRPPIHCNDKIPLYLTKKYEEVLNTFLNDEFLPLGTGGIMNPARAVGESAERKDFLENYIKIYYGHWGGYWQLYSYPQAYSITFDKTMKYARIDFRLVYQGGEAFLKNENGVWILISSKLTWIE